MLKNWWSRLKPLTPSSWASNPHTPGLVAAALSLAVFGLGTWTPLERLAYNALFQMRSRLTQPDWDDRIVVIAIDERSLERYGRFPLSRDYYANLLNTLLAVQPAAIGFDLILAESTIHDTQFAESMIFSGNVVLAVGVDGEGKPLDVSPTIADPAKGTFLRGHIKHNPDGDGISRGAWLYAGRLPMLGVALLNMYRTNLAQTLGTDVTQVPGFNTTILDHPDDLNNQVFWVNWPGTIQLNDTRPGTLRVLSFVDVMENRVDLSQLQNKIVLVGVTAAALDPLRMPFDSSTPTAGVYLHAAVVDNVLRDRFLRRLPPWGVGLLILGVGIGTNWVLKPLGAKGRFILLVSLVPGWLVLAYGGLEYHWWLPVAAPLGTCLLSAISLQFGEQQERQSLMDLFALNTSPEMAELMWQHKAEILDQGQIEPQELMVTVLFSDIRGFTSITEALPSKVLLPWLNRYFEVMTDCIMAHGGVVDKYIGDAIMAVFGAPLPHTLPGEIHQDAIAAVKASLAMHQCLHDLNQEFGTAGLPTIRFGIGIHTGRVIAGTVGSRKRISYSLFGDTVNVAARLQDMTKSLTATLPYSLLMSEETYIHVESLYRGQAMGEVQLRGRTTLTPVYTLVEKAREAGAPIAIRTCPDG